MKNYVIHRAGAENELGKVTVQVHDEDKAFWLNPKASLKVRNHSPTGFEFGYGGSGPAQLALAILMDFTGQTPTDMYQPWQYQDFKFKFIAPLKHPGGTILGDDIQAWLEKEGKHENQQ